MFIYTVRSSSVKFFAVLVLTLTVLIALILSGGSVFASAEPVGTVSFEGISSKEARVGFLSSQGLTVKEGSEEECEFVMPENFDRVMAGYNQIQKAQGLDISKYAKKKVTRYTYIIENYENYDGTVYANLLIYRDRIIACDVSSADPKGFVNPVVKQ